MSAKSAMDVGTARRWMRQMLLIRKFEERCVQLYSQTKIRGFLHLYIGQEAVAVGAMDALRPEDWVVAHYREHGHALARGISTRAVMAEMLGKVSGTSRGRGGSMHLFDRETRFVGGSAIVGSGIPLGVGLALGDRVLGRKALAAVFFGDGAVAEGAFHESLNLASLWNLPVLFLCENNYYAMGTAFARHQAQHDLVLKARGYGISGATVDGMDVETVAEAVREAADEVRARERPRFLELRTYRFRAHSMYDPELYREKAEVEAWRERDPLTVFSSRARTQQLLDDAALRELEADAAREVEDAVAFAEAAPFEEIDELTRFVHSEEVRS